MKKTAVVIAPGRGTYNKAELGYLKRYHAGQTAHLFQFDEFRAQQGQTALSTLDSAPRFSPQTHTRGDNASPLIYASAYFDFLAISQDQFDIIGITGNSMGWYIALACAGALTGMGGLQVVNTMGTLMQKAMIGGQLVYPVVDDSWRPLPGARSGITDKMADICSRAGHHLSLSIDLGGMLVLAGNEPGLTAFERGMPRLQDRYPMRLTNHAAFHTPLQRPIAAEGQALLPASLFAQPNCPLIDGRGVIWRPKATDLAALWSYTLNQQVVEPYDFRTAIKVAAREFCPDVFIVLGPGTTLGGATAQALTGCNWQGADDKASFKAMQDDRANLLMMGDGGQRAGVVG